MRFLKSLRLRKRSEFLAVKRNNKLLFGSFILIEKRTLPTSTPTKLGITVIRKYGKSHERNRFKRLIREAFRLSHSILPIGLEIIVKPRSKAKEAKMQDLQNELILLLCKDKTPIAN